jgi:tyrosinase
MKKLVLIILLLSIFVSSKSQSIRKPWSELTTSEKSAFVDALKDLSSADVDNLADEHVRLFGPIHEDDALLPWHRIFLNYFEELLQDQNASVTLPYWDWHEESSWTGSHNLFENASGGNTGLFGFNIIESGSPWSFTRNFQSTWLPDANDPNMNQSSVTAFSFDLEIGNHNAGHNFIRGTMASGFSPGDPIFYLHHNMVDKVWADWFRLHPTSTGSGLNTSMVTFQDYPGYPNTIDATHYVDPRDEKIWFAFDNILLLDKYIATGSESYYYSTGKIHIDDFVISNGTNVVIRTNGNNIKIIKDFNAVLGSQILIDTQ